VLKVKRKKFWLLGSSIVFKLFFLFQSRLNYFEKFILRFISTLISPKTEKKKLYYVRFGGYIYNSRIPHIKVRGKHRRRRKKRWFRKFFRKGYIKYKLIKFNSKFINVVAANLEQPLKKYYKYSVSYFSTFRGKKAIKKKNW